jgi:HD-GYP domain-containing protein (c-di-GMP phosphodiesterase class II)
MLVRSVKMYSPDNKVFDKPLMQLQDVLNAILARDSRSELITVKDAFYLNNMLVKVDIAMLDNVKWLISELRARDVGGFSLSKSATVEELKRFIGLFGKDESGPAGETGDARNRLLSMTLLRWSKLAEKLKAEPQRDQHIDRKKYALTVYGRAVFFVRKYMASLNDGAKPLNTVRALRIIQDFVDISYEHKTHFLGLTTVHSETEYLAYHQVNVCMMAIVFGAELGLTKLQLRDLGYIALFYNAGMGTMSHELLTKKGALTAQEKATVQRTPLLAVRNILRERTVNRSTLLRLVTTFEYKVDFSTAVRDEHGNVQMVIPKADLGLYAKIICICDNYDALTSKRPFRDAYGPDVALLLMWTELQNKFDPELLRVFMKVMAIAPVKVLAKHQQTLTLSGV